MISETIHVAYPDILHLGEHVNASDLASSLAHAGQKATAIEILGGYFSVSRTFEIFRSVPKKRRAACRIRLAVGIDANAKIIQHWNDMRLLEQHLRKAGFRNITLAIVSGRRHFHSKLFHFLRSSHHVWFVGSANPGSDRHELMVSFSGRHDALGAYIDAVFAVAQPVTKQPPIRQSPSNLREFFLTGSLLHRTAQRSPFTFDAFRLDQDDREKMMKYLTADVVPHAKPKTQGFAFSLRSAVETPDFAEDDQDDIAKVQLRVHSLDTTLGLWAPRFYVEQIRAQLSSSLEARKADLRRFADKLLHDNSVRAYAAFSDYISSMERLLENIGIAARPVEKRELSFDRFIISRQRMLSTEEGIARLAQRLDVVDMPDIWYDARAATAFESSAFSDLGYRLPTRQRIIRAFIEGLSLSDQPYVEASGLKERLEDRLTWLAWRDSEWNIV
ncbi:hypothetical protein AGR1A_pAt10033 [Agrobacterium fabacearum CFBP 5771]|uniref:restriction endonuclease PLD domain-containing protein n=1 Tax=Agrobacterium tumefaciens TaxID=358 RepID=UPI0009BC1E15|nr:restriction endonuclease PLD domain-containing protein [Agrobacterium tumefaciens]CVI23686.1 hypothetical protein AGR1A_pAt10033 [Agrobacterium fabacearum CFBP 5771]